MKGPLSGATVQIFALSDQVNPVAVVTTDDTGAFKLKTALPNPANYYLIEATGGTDVDANDDGIRDATPTPNLGTLLAVATGADINSGHVHATVLSDIIWRLMGMGVGGGDDTDSPTVSAELERITALVLKSGLAGDINGDGVTDYHDILAFIPANSAHRSKLAIDYALIFQAVDATVDNSTLADKYHTGDSALTADIRRVFSSLAAAATPQFVYPALAKTVKVSVSVIGGGNVTGPDLAGAVVHNGATSVVTLPRSETASTQFTATVTDPAYQFNSWTGCTQVSGAVCQVGLDQSGSVSARFERINPVLADGVPGISNIELYQGISDVIFNGTVVTFTTQLPATQALLNAAVAGTILKTQVKAHALIKVVDIISRTTDDNGVLTASFDFADVGPLDVYKSFSAIDSGQPVALADITSVTVADGLTDSDGNAVAGPVATDPNGYPALPPACDPQTDPVCASSAQPPPCNNPQNPTCAQVQARNKAVTSKTQVALVAKESTRKRAVPVWIAGIGHAYNVGKGLYLADAAPGQRGLRLLKIEKAHRVSGREALRIARRDCSLKGHAASCALLAQAEADRAHLQRADFELPLFQKPVQKKIDKSFGPGNALVAEATISLGLNISLTPQASFDYQSVPLSASATLGADITMDPALGLTLSVGTNDDPSPSEHEPSDSDKQRYTKKYAQPAPPDAEHSANLSYTVLSIDTSQFMGVVGAVLESSFDIDIGVDISGNITLTVTPGFHAQANGSTTINAGCPSSGCSIGATATGSASAYPVVTSSLTGTASISPYVQLSFNVGIQKVLPKTGSLFLRPFVSAEGTAETGFQYGPMTRPGTRLYNNSVIVTMSNYAATAATIASTGLTPQSPTSHVPALFAPNVASIFATLAGFDAVALGNSSGSPDIEGYRSNATRAATLDNLIGAVTALKDDRVLTEPTPLSAADVSRLQNEGQAVTTALRQMVSSNISAFNLIVNVQVPIGTTFCLEQPQIAVGVSWGYTVGLELTSANWPFPLSFFKFDKEFDFLNKQWSLFQYPNADLPGVPSLPSDLACPSS